MFRRASLGNNDVIIIQRIAKFIVFTVTSGVFFSISDSRTRDHSYVILQMVMVKLTSCCQYFTVQDVAYHPYKRFHLYSCCYIHRVCVCRMFTSILHDLLWLQYWHVLFTSVISFHVQVIKQAWYCRSYPTISCFNMTQ